MAEATVTPDDSTPWTPFGKLVIDLMDMTDQQLRKVPEFSTTYAHLHALAAVLDLVLDSSQLTDMLMYPVPEVPIRVAHNAVEILKAANHA